jgi:hypothetical protein
VFYNIKWIISGAFEFEKKTNKQSLKIDQGKQKKLGMLLLNVIKQLQQYDVLSSTEKQY